MITIKHTAGVIPKKELKKVPKDFYAKHSDGTNWVYFETKQERDDYFSNLPIAEEDPMLIGQAEYEKRVEDGKRFVAMMNTRLNLFEVDGKDDNELDDIKKVISNFYRDAMIDLSLGAWKSAQRLLEEMQPNEGLYIKKSTFDFMKSFIDDYVLNSYKKK